MRGANALPVILFIGVNPKDTLRLRLDEEARRIEEALQPREGMFTFLYKGAVPAEGLRELLLRQRPRVVQLSGHAEEAGFKFENDGGTAVLMRTDALADLFGLVKKDIHCVVLSACQSHRIAEAIGQHIPYVISMRGAIGDRAAQVFASGFYTALAHDHTYDIAFEHGRNAIDIKNIAESRVPVLNMREGAPALRLFDGLPAAWAPQYRGFVLKYLAIAAEGTTVLPRPRMVVPLSLRVDASSLPRDASWPHPKLLSEEDLMELCCASGEGQGAQFVVSGEPGSGKTGLLQRMAARLAQKSAGPLPLYLPIGPILQEKLWVTSWLERRMRLSSPDADRLSERLDEQGEQGQLVVLIDGLDALGGELRSDALLAISALIERWPKAAFLVAARPYTPVEVDGPRLRRLEIQPLSSAQQAQLLSAHLGPGSDSSANIDAVLRELARNPSLRGLAGTCLGLTIIAPLAKHQEQLTRGPLLLMEQFIRFLLTGRSASASQPFPHPEATLAALRLLAFKMTGSTHDACSIEQLETFLFDRDALETRQRIEHHPPWRQGGVRAFLQEQADKLGILGPYERTEDDTPPRWRFAHDALCDALAAAELKARLGPTADPAQLVALIAVDAEIASAWYEPVTILVADADVPDQLAVQLGLASAQLGMRLLQRVPHLAPPTISTLLGASGHWQQRSRVFARIHELVGDAHQTIALLDRIRRGTRSGNDLYFIDQALRRLATDSPEVAEQVAQKRRQLFAHIPLPATPILIETKEERVPLFCDVPPGEVVRAPDSLLGRIRKLRARAGYQLSCVPITRALYAAFDPVQGSTLWRPNYPVVNITWYEATMFCRWLATLDTAWAGARLPREAEWEYACLYGTHGQPYCCGDASALPGAAWYSDTATEVRRVARLQPSQLGLYDLHGNVGEWCEDLWEPPASAQSEVVELALHTDTSSQFEEGFKALRGGCYLAPADALRVGTRAQAATSLRSDLFGFRVLVPQPKVRP